MKKVSKALLATSLILLSGCSKGDTVTVKVGTGGTGGTYYNYMTKLESLVTSDTSTYKINVKTTAGSAANIRLLSSNFLDFAIVQSDVLETAANGKGAFEKDGSLDGFSAVAALYTEAIQVVVSASSDIYSIEDMKGRSVSVGEEDSGVVFDAEQLLDNYGLDFDDIDAHYMSFADSADAIRTGSIEAFFVTAGAPTAAIKELAEEKDVRILSFDESDLKRLLNKYSGYTTCTIPADTYKGQTEEIKTLGVKAVLVANNKLSDDTVKSMTEYLFKFASKLSGYTVTDGELDVTAATTSVPIAFHPGAAKYYSEKNVTVKTSDGGNKNNVNAGQDD